MANLKLTNLITYKAYFEAVATEHIAIDGFKWGDQEVIMNDNRSDMAARVLWVMPYEAARYGDKYSDNVQKTKQARVCYLLVPASNSFDHMLQAFVDAEAVIEQIIARIYKDKAGEAVMLGEPPVASWTMIVSDVSSWTTGPVEMTIGATKYAGCELMMDFRDNAGLEYDPTKWNT